MKLTFDKNKFARRFRLFLSVVISWLIPSFAIYIEFLLISPLQKTVNNRLFTQLTIGNFLVIILWFMGAPLSYLCWRASKKLPFLSFWVYPTALFLVSLIPLLVQQPNSYSLKAVNSAIINTKIYFVAFYIALIIGYIVNLAITKANLKKSNWWLFVVAIPYLLTIFTIYAHQKSFFKFLHFDDFSVKNVSMMLKHVHFLDVRLMNPLWFETIALIIVSMMILEGVTFGAIIWQKTKKWRKGRKEKISSI